MKFFKEKGYALVYESLEKKYKIYSHGAKSLLEFSGIKENANVIDLGCGTGISTYEISKQIKGKIIGIDISKVMLKVAKNKLKEKALLICADAFTLDKIIKEKVDALLSSYTYYYFLSDIEKLFSCVYNILRKDGIFCFNITSYLTPLIYKNKEYNTFAYEMFKATEKILNAHGYEYKAKNWKKEFEAEIELVRNCDKPGKILEKIGFSEIECRVVEMPVTNIKALEFTYEGFWSRGKISYCQVLNRMEKEKANRLMEEIVKQTIEKWKEKGKVENPKYFEVKAIK